MTHLAVPGGAARPPPKPTADSGAKGDGAGGSSSSRKKKKSLSTNILLLDQHGNNVGRVGIREIIGSRNGPGVYEPSTPTAGGGGGFPEPTSTKPTPAQAQETSLISAVSFRVVQALERFASKVYTSNAAMEVLRQLDLAWATGQAGRFAHTRESLATLGSNMRLLCAEAMNILKWEPPLVTMSSPVYVFGDIHGNFADLHFFLRELIMFGDLKYTSHSFLFLGDYVDRGEFSVECIAYLLAIKVLSESSVYLLRGNHESPEVNGDEVGYGTWSFKHQCRQRFGPELGEELWRDTNRVFTYMPLCASVDGRIFCVHGGIPRYSGGRDDRLEILRTDHRFPRFAVVQSMPTATEDPETRVYRQITNDLLWSDPADDEKTSATLNEWGFGPNPRGPGTISFGSVAVDTFLQNTGHEFIFRAHQEKSDGLKLAKSGRVVTIFSTSDYSGHQNGGGVVFVSQSKIRMIIKQPYGREPPLPAGTIAPAQRDEKRSALGASGGLTNAQEASQKRKSSFVVAVDGSSGASAAASDSDDDSSVRATPSHLSPPSHAP